MAVGRKRLASNAFAAFIICSITSDSWSGSVYSAPTQARRFVCSLAKPSIWISSTRPQSVKPNPMWKIGAAGVEVRAKYMAVPLLAVAAMLAPAVAHADPLDDYVSRKGNEVRRGAR